MHFHTTRRMIVSLLTITVFGVGGGLFGCDDDTPWEHPNRQRFPAPPTEEDQSKSVEELEREWARQDRLQEMNPSEPLEAQAATRNTLRQATDYLQQALETALGSISGPSLDTTEPEAVGGGPAPKQTRARDPENDPGDM